MTHYYQHAGITIYHACAIDFVFHNDIACDVMLSDPPYGIALKEHGRNGYDWQISGDSSQEVGHMVLSWALERELPTVVFASPKKPWEGAWRQWLVWDKGPAVGGGGDYKTCWKFDWELIQIRDTGHLHGQRDSSVLRYHIGRNHYKFHPCQKPTKLLYYLIQKTTYEGGIVFDPFMGSGSTLVAAKNMGRKAIGIEIEEKYCEIAANRLRQDILF